MKTTEKTQTLVTHTLSYTDIIEIIEGCMHEGLEESEVSALLIGGVAYEPGSEIKIEYIRNTGKER